MTSPRPAGSEGPRRDARQAGPASPGAAGGPGGSLENGPAGQAARARAALVDAFVLMSPILLRARLSAWACRGLRLHAAADWLSRRRFLLRGEIDIEDYEALSAKDFGILTEIDVKETMKKINRDMDACVILGA